MKNQETIIDLLKKNIGNNTRKERIQIINNAIEKFHDYGQQNSYSVAEMSYGIDFLQTTQSLIKAIGKARLYSIFFITTQCASR